MLERSQNCHPEKKDEGKFPFRVAGFYRFFHSFFMCTFCTFMHIILNEMSQEKYLPFAHKFFPSFSVQIPDVVNIARLSLAPQKNLSAQASNLSAIHDFMWVYVPSTFKWMPLVNSINFNGNFCLPSFTRVNWVFYASDEEIVNLVEERYSSYS